MIPRPAPAPRLRRGPEDVRSEMAVPCEGRVVFVRAAYVGTVTSRREAQGVG